MKLATTLLAATALPVLLVRAELRGDRGAAARAVAAASRDLAEDDDDLLDLADGDEDDDDLLDLRDVRDGDEDDDFAPVAPGTFAVPALVPPGSDAVLSPIFLKQSQKQAEYEEGLLGP